jgi:hypothetical protein
MSDDILSVIPDDPQYVPDHPAQQISHALFSSFVAKADEVKLLVYDDVHFIDPGENFSSVTCPVCGTDISAWWQEAMQTAYDQGFADLTITTPCCNSTGSLNDLNYDWPAGFASFALQARNPHIDINEGQLGMLASMLKCQLRKIWTKA